MSVRLTAAWSCRPSCPSHALLALTAADREPLFLVEPGHQLVVDAPALALEPLVQPAIAEATMLAGKGTKPLT